MWIRTCYFSLPLVAALLDVHPYKVLQGKSQRRRRDSVSVEKHWNKLPTSVATAPSAKISKKRLEEVWREIFPHLPEKYPDLLNTHLLNALTIPFHLTATQ